MLLTAYWLHDFYHIIYIIYSLKNTWCALIGVDSMDICIIRKIQNTEYTQSGVMKFFFWICGGDCKNDKH